MNKLKRWIRTQVCDDQAIEPKRYRSFQINIGKNAHPDRLGHSGTFDAINALETHQIKVYFTIDVDTGEMLSVKARQWR